MEHTHMGKVHLRCTTWYNGQFVLGCQICLKMQVSHGKMGMLWAYSLIGSHSKHSVYGKIVCPNLLKSEILRLSRRKDRVRRGFVVPEVVPSYKVYQICTVML